MSITIRKEKAFPAYPDVTTPALDKPVTTPNNPNLELPTFCNWATPICSFVDWFKDDSVVPDAEKYDLKEFDYSKLPSNPDFSFSQSCPVPLSIPLDFGIVSSSIEISYEPFCQFFAKARHSLLLLPICTVLLLSVALERKLSNGWFVSKGSYLVCIRFNF